MGRSAVLFTLFRFFYEVWIFVEEKEGKHRCYKRNSDAKERVSGDAGSLA